jgi:hypothetical protein
MFRKIGLLFAPVFKDMLTNKVQQYEPIRVVGIPSFALGVITYLSATIVTVWKQGTLNWVEWSTGFTALMTAVIALAAAMRVKENTEVQPHELPGGPPAPTPDPPPNEVVVTTSTTVQPKVGP